METKMKRPKRKPCKGKKKMCGLDRSLENVRKGKLLSFNNIEDLITYLKS